MVFETEIEREEKIKKQTTKKSKRKHVNKIKIIGSIVLFIVSIFLVYKFYKEWNFNQEIVKNESQKIELTELKEINLWNKTIQNIKDYNKYIEINYNNYNLKLDSEKLEKNNKLEIQVNNKKSNDFGWENQDILEIDVSKMQPYNILEQIELNCNQLLKGLDEIDIYGIKAKDKKREYIETKEIHEDNITLVLREEYERYILVYVPIQEIKIEKEEIELMKDDSYQMQIKIEPSNATTKMIHIDDLKEGSIIEIKEKGIIHAIETGTTEFELEAEKGKIKKKIKVTVKDNIEKTQPEEEQVEDTKIASQEIDTVQIRTDDKQINSNVSSNYINGILIVNKKYSLPGSYDPGTNPEALQAFYDMKTKAKEEGISLKIVSGYRDYQTQQSIYQRNVQLYGEEVANTFSAKPRTI